MLWGVLLGSTDLQRRALSRQSGEADDVAEVNRYGVKSFGLNRLSSLQLFCHRTEGQSVSLYGPTADSARGVRGVTVVISGTAGPLPCASPRGTPAYAPLPAPPGCLHTVPFETEGCREYWNHNLWTDGRTDGQDMSVRSYDCHWDSTTCWMLTCVAS